MKKMSDQAKKKTGDVAHIVGNVIGIVLIVVLLPVMIVNMTLIIKSYANPRNVPTFLGVAPLIVQSGSMHPDIMVDDLIFTREVDADTLKVGDVIAFQPADAFTVVTHRIKEINVAENGVTEYTMKGDANNTVDADTVVATQIVGLYFGRIEGAGKIALFLQQPIGMVVFVAVPLALFLLYDVLRRAIYGKKKKQEDNAEKEELERLRALAAGIEPQETPEVPAEEPEAEVIKNPEPDLEPEPAQEEQKDEPSETPAE